MTAADRPFVTDNALAEAQRRYQGDWDPYYGEPVDDAGVSEAERRAFVAGAEWAAGRTETTTAYEQCVTDAEGRCTRWSHDHSAETTTATPEPEECEIAVIQHYVKGTKDRPLTVMLDACKTHGVYVWNAQAHRETMARLPDQPTKVKTTTGKCPSCGYRYPLGTNGRLISHLIAPNALCSGSGVEPEVERDE